MADGGWRENPFMFNSEIQNPHAAFSEPDWQLDAGCDDPQIALVSATYAIGVRCLSWPHKPPGKRLAGWHPQTEMPVCLENIQDNCNMLAYYQ